MVYEPNHISLLIRTSKQLLEIREANKKLDNSIQELTKKQIIELKQWEAIHPNYLNNNNEYIEWHKMVQNLMGGGTLQAQNKNTESIKKVISQTVDIKDAIKN